MNIVLVGVDGTGKTTVAQKLSEMLTMPIYDGTGAHDSKRKRWDKLKEYGGTIFDRVYPIDDMVYSRLRGEPGVFTYPDLLCFDDASRWMLIYLTSDKAKENLTSRGDDEITVDDIDTLDDIYRYVLSETEYIEVDNTHFDAVETIATLYTILNQ